MLVINNLTVMKKKYSILFLTFLLALSSCSNDNETNESTSTEAFQYLGLKDIANVSKAKEAVFRDFGRPYHPTMQILDNYIYVNTLTGVYRKDINTINNTDWELFAFQGIPIIQFIKKGNHILAISGCADERAFLYSSDNGENYKSITPSSFILKENEYKVIPYSIAQNPKNPNSFLALVEPIGVVKSTNFGQSWTVLNKEYAGYQNWFVGFNSNDTTNIYYTGESMTFESLMYSSEDNGDNWQLIESVDNNCIHHIAFHPTDSNILLYSGEYMVKKSIDKGETWESVLNGDLYFYKTIFDKNTPSVLYTSGVTRLPQDEHKFMVYKSTNGGDSWEILFQAELSGTGGIIDFEFYKNRLYLYTYTDGIYMLEVANNRVGGK